MLNKRKNYLRIMAIELEDLTRDIERLIELCNREREAGRFTNYVFMENLATFKNELLGVNAFGRILDTTDPERFSDLEAMIDHLKGSFAEKVRACGLVEAVNICIRRKLDKVARYVTQ